ncbi:amidoligase family protein [Clostridium perfringens]|uniref:amidoligase family protein n=1 Tax=Clostridium perfringens TaxID=1502 RepID=UPI001E33C318|nr:amidoligase family protein [Clostridium perfringens]WVL78289.1 amidoligase family protein [Clostridium perfringens]
MLNLVFSPQYFMNSIGGYAEELGCNRVEYKTFIEYRIDGYTLFRIKEFKNFVKVMFLTKPNTKIDFYVKRNEEFARYLTTSQFKEELKKNVTTFKVSSIVECRMIKEMMVDLFNKPSRNSMLIKTSEESLLPTLGDGNLKDFKFNRDLKFGVEIEVTVRSESELVRKLEERGIKVVDVNNTHEVVENGWKIVYDGSVEGYGGYRGVEIVSPPSSDIDELQIVCEVLQEVEAKVNSSCGLHVHHDINDLKRKQIMRVYNFYNKYEKAINLMFTKKRIENRYCRPVSRIIDKVNNCDTKHELLRDIAGKGRGGYYNNCRYYTVNLRSYLYYGTIEFRQHNGTINIDEIASWIAFTHKIVERGLQIGNDIVYNVGSLSKKELYNEMMKEVNLENTLIDKNMREKINKVHKRSRVRSVAA